VEVFIFDDRLEVVSPGRLPGSVRVHNIRDEHFARNPRVARALADLGLVGDVGEGVDRMYEEMANADLPPPEFEDRGSSVRVTLRRAAVAEPDPEVEPTQRVIHIPGNLAQTLNSRQVAALRFLRTHDRIVTSDLMRLFPHITDRTASRDLNELVKLRLLRRVGRTFGTYYHAEGATYRLPNEI
jgi:ATP-dependent DNA helicase RecG